MTVQDLIDILYKLPNLEARILVWDPVEEVSGEIQRVQDIIHPTDHKEVYLITDFG